MNLNWLQITDFHARQTGQKQLWPQARHTFIEKLPDLWHDSGPWDLVFFTGDLAFSGSEYTEVDSLLKDLFDVIGELQDPLPVFLAVPGNHDLKRPADNDQGVLFHRSWATDKAQQHNFWEDKRNVIRRSIEKAFSDYTNWWTRQPVWAGLPGVAPPKPGLLPGDFAFTLEKDGVRFGVLGLNSAFLQLTGADYDGKLGLGMEQFNAACDGDGPAWAGRHCANLLLTHHPASWLERGSRGVLMEQIMGDRRFALHLCGHLHETRTEEVSISGDHPRAMVQARSLFGLEHYWTDGEPQERFFGYVAGRLSVDQQGQRGEWTIWPRKYHLQGRDWNIIRDPDVALDEARGSKAPSDFTPNACAPAPRGPGTPPAEATGPASEDPSEPLAKAVDEVLQDTAARPLRDALAASPRPLDGTVGTSLFKLAPMEALLRLKRAILRARRAAGSADWSPAAQSVALRIYGLMLGRCIKIDAPAPREPGKMQLKLRTRACAEVLWLHWHGDGEEPRFVVLERPLFGEPGGEPKPEDRLWGERDVLRLEPSEAGHGRKPYLYQLKAHLWRKVIHTEDPPMRFDKGSTERLERALASSAEPIYGTLRSGTPGDPLDDPEIRRFLAEDIKLPIFEVTIDLQPENPAADWFEVDEVELRDQIDDALHQIRG